MAYNFSPRIVTDGLVLYLDAANPKSYNTVNLARNSEALDLWNNNGLGGAISVTANVEVAPNGTLTAETLAQNPSVSGASRWVSSITRTYTAGVTYTLSIWLKKISGVDPQPNIWLWVNGAYTLIGPGPGDNTIGTITTDWVRYSFTFTPVTTVTNAFSGLALGWDINGQANDFVFAAWGFQIEVGSSATTYIPSTNTWTDLTGNNLNGSLINEPTFFTANNGYIRCDGSDDYIEVLDNSLLDFGSNNFTVEYWFRKLSTSVGVGNDNIWGVNKWNTGASPGTNEWTLSIGNTDVDKYSFSVGVGATQYSTGVSVDQLSLNIWYQLVGVRNGGSLQTYLNGELKQNVSSVGFSSSSVINNVGRNLRINNSAVNSFYTRADSSIVRIYNRALSETEINQNYNTTKSRFGL